MPREGDKWRVASGDCLWKIASNVYGKGTRWPEIAAANGLATSGNPIIYPGQLFVLPGITSGSGSLGPAPNPDPPKQQVRIDWFSLTAGSQRNMECLFSWSGEQRFHVRWEYYDRNGNKWLKSDTPDYRPALDAHPETTESFSDNAKACRLSIRPVTDNIEYDEHGNPHTNGTRYQDNTEWAIREYDFSNNPPSLPPNPEVSINSTNRITVVFNNIDPDINGDKIQIDIYQDDTKLYRTAKVSIHTETHFARYVGDVDPGHEYKVRAKALRGNIEGGWTNFTNNEQSLPIAPSEITELRTVKISEQQATQYGVIAEWPTVATANQYELQWTTNQEYFDTPSSEVHSQTTEVDAPPRLLITDIEVGHNYYFRVGSINDKGHSIGWSAVRAVTLGTKPSAPTTWSNVSSGVIGEDINLYWKHNSTDGSLETWARIHITAIDSAHPELEPMEYIKTIENTRPEEQRDQNGVYTINTNDPEWSGLLSAGFIIKWKVQTAGVNTSDEGGYSDWSIEREINIYAKPTIELDMINRYGASINEVDAFPFYLNLLSGPVTQTPISYYIEIVSNDKYDTVDNVGKLRSINIGDKIYQKYYDPDRNAWEFMLEMTPAIIDLVSGHNYTVNVTVSMNSGLSATTSKSFDVYLSESGYRPYADIIIDEKLLTANIHPYCMENYEEGGEILERLAENCLVSVYRREYDGTFTEIASNIENSEDTYVLDPHPSLDYARYRIVAKSSETGAIAFYDIDGVKIGEPSIVIQWGEDWSDFDVNSSEEEADLNNSEYNIGPGSIIKLPYNVDTSESRNPDVSLVNYVGRENPVSYYGTHIGETSKLNSVIASTDKETIYALRRLARWLGDVYIREPSGTGYWANIKVTFNIKHTELTIPVSIDVTRVEGGM